MTKRWIGAWAATTFCSICIAGVANADTPTSATSELALIEGFLVQPAVAEAITAGREHAAAAGTAEPWSLEPSLELRHERSYGAATAFSTTAIGGGLGLDVSGRQHLRQRAADHRAEGAWADAASAHRARLCGFRGGVLDAAWAQRRRHVLEHRHELLSGLLDTVAGLVDAGEVSSHDRDRFELQLQTHAHELERVLADEAAAEAVVTHWTGVMPGWIELLEPPTLLPLDELLDGTASVHPSLEAARARADAAELEARAARRASVPGLDLYGAYRVDAAPGVSSGSGFEAGLSVDLPWPGEGRADAATAEAERASEVAEEARLRTEIKARMEGAYARAAGDLGDPGAHGVDLDRLWDASWGRYQAGEASITELVDSLMGIEQQELSTIDRSFERRHAALELACTSCRFFEEEVERLLQEVER